MASALEMLSSIVPQREVPATQAVNPMGEGLAAQADPNIVAERMKSYEMLQGVDPNPVRMPLSPLGALEQQHGGDAVAMLKSATQQMTQNAPPENVYEFVRKQAMAAAAQKDTKLQAKHRDRVKDVLKESMPGVDVEQIPFDHMVRLAAEGGQLADPFAVGFFKPQDEETKQMYDLAAKFVKPLPGKKGTTPAIIDTEFRPFAAPDISAMWTELEDTYGKYSPEQRQKFLEILSGVSQSVVPPVEGGMLSKLAARFERGDQGMIGTNARITEELGLAGDGDFNKFMYAAQNAVRGAHAIEPNYGGKVGLLQRGLLDTAEMAPSIAVSQAITGGAANVFGAVGKAATAVEGAAAADKLSRLGSAAAKVGGMVGRNAPTTAFWAAQTYPQLKDDLVASGIDDGMATGMALVGSALIGSIEQFNPGHGLGGPKLTASTGLERRMAELLVKSGINFGKEWGEEGLQQLSDWAVKVAAEQVGGDIDWATEWEKGIDQIAEAAIPLMVMQGPGTARKGIQQFRKGLQDPARWASADLMRTLTPEQRKGLRSDDTQTRARAFWQLPRDVREALFSTDINQRGRVADKYAAEADEMREQKQPITPPRGPMSADTDELLQKDLQKEKAWIPTPEEIGRAVDDARKAPTFSEEDVNVPSDKMTETERIPASPEQAAKSREAIRNRLRSIGDKRTAAAMEEYMARKRPPEIEPESVAEPEQQTTEPPVERPKLGDKMQQQAERRQRRRQQQKEAGVVAPSLEEKQASEQKRREDAEALALRSVQGEDVQKPEDMSQQGWNALKRQQAKKAGIAPRSIGDKADVVSEEQVRVSDKTEEAPTTSDREFGESIAAEREKVIGQLMATGLQRADAEDAFSNATLEVLQNRSKVDPEKPIGALLLDVAKKRAKDSFRKRRREKQASDVVEPVAQAEMPVAEGTLTRAELEAKSTEDLLSDWRKVAKRRTIPTDQYDIVDRTKLIDGLMEIHENWKAKQSAIPSEKPKKKGPVQKKAEQKQPWEMSLTEFVPEEKIDDQAVFDEHRKSVMDAIERGDIESHPDYPETVRKAVQESAESPAQVLGDMSKKKSVSGADIGRLLAAQKNNVDARAEGVAGRDAESLADRWVASDEFVLMDIPVGMARPATAPEGAASVTPDMPIVVDRNKTGAGRVHGKFGAPADIIIIDGKHRHATAENSGQATIKAWVGKEAVPLIEKAQQPTIGKKATAESVGTSEQAPTKPKAEKPEVKPLNRQQRYAVATLLSLNTLEQTIDRLKGQPQAEEAIAFAREIFPLYKEAKRKREVGHLPRAVIARVNATGKPAEKPKPAKKKGPVQRKDWKPSVVEAVKGTEKTIPEVFEDAKRANPSLTLDEFKAELEQMHERGEVQLREYTLAPANITEEDGITLKKEAIEHKGGDPYWFVRESPQWWKDRTADRRVEKPAEPAKKKGPVQKKAVPVQGTDAQDVQRIADKLVAWKGTERLTDPENFRSSWTEYDVDKQKAIVKELVDRGELPVSFSRMREKKNRAYLTATELLDGLTRNYANDKYKKPKASDAKREAFKKAGQAFVDGFGMKVDGDKAPDRVKLAADLLFAAIDLGITQFSEFITEFVKDNGRDTAIRLASELQAAWTTARKFYPSKKLGEVGSVADILAEEAKKPEKPAELPRPPKEEPEPPPVAGKSTGIKNRKSDEMRKDMGLPPLPGVPTMTREAMVKEAEAAIAETPDLPQMIVGELLNKPRGLSWRETTILEVYLRKLSNSIYSLTKERDKAMQDGDEQKLNTTVDAIETAEDNINRVLLVSGRGYAGTEWSLSGNARQIELMPDMTLNRMLKDAKNAKGKSGKVSAAEAAKMAQMAEEIERLRARNEELERDAAERVYNNQIDKDIEEQSGKKPKRRQKSTAAKEKADKQANVIRDIVSKIMSPGFAYDPKREGDLAADLVKACIKYIVYRVDAGVKTMTEILGELKEKFTPEEFDATTRPAVKEAWQKAIKDGDIAGPEIDTTSLASISKAARKIEKEVIRQGFDEGRLVPDKIKAEHRQYVLDAVREEMDIYMPGITERQLKEALAGYGLYVELSDDEKLAIQRDLHGQFRQLSKLDDMAEKKLPKVSGREMPEPTEEERRLILKVNDGLKNNELIPQDGARLQKSALESAKRALRNRMDDMEEELKTGERILRKKREFETDEDYENMRKEYEALKIEHAEKFPKIVTEEQKIAAVLNGLERAIKNLEEMLRNHDVMPKGKDPVTSPEIEAARARLDVLRTKRDELRKNDPKYQAMLEERRERAKEKDLERKIGKIEKALKEHKLMPEAKRDPATNDAIKEKEAQLKKLRKDLEEARDNDPEYQAMIEERRRAAYKSLIAERLEQMLLRQQEESDVLAEIQRNKPSLRKRLFESKQERKERKEKRKQLFEKAGVQFKPKEKKERVIDDETLDNLWKIEQIKKEHRKNLETWRKESNEGWKMAYDFSLQTIMLSRAVKTAMDYSMLGKQAVFTTYSHPLLTIKNLPETWRATFGKNSKKEAFRIREEIKRRANYRLYLESGLAITELDGHIDSKEEMFAGRWSQRIYGVAASERAYVTFLNLVRADVFDAMAAGLSRHGTLTKDEAAWIASVVNTFTGRGSLPGQADQALTMASFAFFAPRYAVSRFQLATLQPIWGPAIGGSRRVAKAAAIEYARALFGAAALYTIALMANAVMDDDDENRPTIEWDPRSADFLKIRIGAQRIDPLGNIAQTVSHIVKSVRKERKTLAGTIVPLVGDDVPFGAMDWWDLQAGYFRSKVSPIVGMGIDIGTERDFFGKEHELPIAPMIPFEWNKAIRETMGDRVHMYVAIGVNQFVPLAWGDMMEAFKELSIPRAMGATLMNFVGMQNSIYEEADMGQYNAEKFRIRTEKSQNENAANIRLHKSQGLMEKLKELEKKYKEDGKDTWEIRMYMNGAARWALGKTEIPKYPNPYTATNLPADVKAAVKEHLATVAVTASGLPEEWKAKPESVAQMRSAVTYLRELGLKTKDLFQDLDRTLYEKHNVKTQEARNARGNKLAERLDN